MCNCINHKFLDNKEALLRIKLYLDEVKVDTFTEIVEMDSEYLENKSSFNGLNFSTECF